MWLVLSTVSHLVPPVPSLLGALSGPWTSQFIYFVVTQLSISSSGVFLSVGNIPNFCFGPWSIFLILLFQLQLTNDFGLLSNQAPDSQVLCCLNLPWISVFHNHARILQLLLSPSGPQLGQICALPIKNLILMHCVWFIPCFFQFFNLYSVSISETLLCIRHSVRYWGWSVNNTNTELTVSHK